MAKKKTEPKKTKTRRGAPDVIAKRRAARALNILFAQEPTTSSVDKRSAKRLARLAERLRNGNNGEALKALDALQCAHELLTSGTMTYSEIRKLKPKVPAMPKGSIERQETADTIVRMQKLYGFHPQAWRLLGVDIGAEMPS